MKVRRQIKDNGERILLLLLLIVLIVYFVKEIYLEDIQLQILQLKYKLSLSALLSANNRTNNNQTTQPFKQIKKSNLRSSHSA